MAGAPYGYRFIRKTEITDGYWEIVETEAEVVRQIFRRYTADDCSIADLTRWVTEQGIPTRKGKAVWDRSTVWGCCATRLPRPGHLRQDESRPPPRQADAHDPRSRRAPRPPAGARR